MKAVIAYIKNVMLMLLIYGSIIAFFAIMATLCGG
ncbi:hypothetical protein LCGC14_1165220 [marine sediment metagenome]|uniref:Uncharacterized protein n=1 Tax=marine sediment metagenome TaxID=412755 RepID=A0A0F9LRI4_9ZZZZ